MREMSFAMDARNEWVVAGTPVSLRVWGNAPKALGTVSRGTDTLVSLRVWEMSHSSRGNRRVSGRGSRTRPSPGYPHRRQRTS